MIRKKDIKLATKLISPEAGKVLAKFRSKSRGMKTFFREPKPLATERRRMRVHPTFSSAEPVFNTVTLPRLEFMALTEKYETKTGEQGNGA